MTMPSRKFSTGRNPSGAAGTPRHVLQTHSYVRFMQKPAGTSLYDKNFGMLLSPRKSDSRIVKNKSNRRRSLEVDRFSNMEQREQYRRLIEQYRASTLQQTSLFSGLTMPKAVLHKTKPEKDETVIDLTDKSPEAAAPTVKKSFLGRESFRRLENVPRISALPLERKLSDSVEKYMPALPVIRQNVSVCKKAESGKILPKLDLSDLTESLENKPLHSFTSPYLSKNFIPDLLKTYGRRERQRQIEACHAETKARQLREKREAKAKMLAEILHEKLQLKETKKELPQLPELTPGMNDMINDALQPFPPHETLSDGFNIQITREHMSTLFGLNWLNDEVINFYMELIVQRSKDRDDLPNVHAMNTFFYPRLSAQKYNSVRRWTKKVDIFSKDIVLYPIHLGVHWCLAVADFAKKEIRYYDSMGGANRECLNILKEYLSCEHKNKKSVDIDLSDWQLLSMSSIPQQMNGSDCGVFTCKFAEYITNQSELTFNQSNMAYFRRAMVWEILNKKLLR